MGVILGKGILIDFMETTVTCPICTGVFDASAKMSKAKYPVFNTKCPKCKGKITISEPMFGGHLKCWETNCPPSVQRLETEMPIEIIILKQKPDGD